MDTQLAMADLSELQNRLLERSRLLGFEPYADAPMRVRDRPSSEQDSGSGDDGEEACAVEAPVSRPRGKTCASGSPDHDLTPPELFRWCVEQEVLRRYGVTLEASVFCVQTETPKDIEIISDLMNDRKDPVLRPSYTILHFPLHAEQDVSHVAAALRSNPVDVIVFLAYHAESDYQYAECRMVPPTIASTQLLPSLLNSEYPIRLACVDRGLNSTFYHDATYDASVAYSGSDNWLFTYESAFSLRSKK
ncbi:hypothetical protein HPB52_001642 [Rhipicephalus sanguineus]|uniref:Uncharacterized protein n=1 Tax=Rhipicephalus sanguineus TaxID=34632 RepID=A0A9D4T2C4_RHISA|nr:hypothetical protein HPB52_001642 [Rhipicephalus sanguineus]